MRVNGRLVEVVVVAEESRREKIEERLTPLVAIA